MYSSVFLFRSLLFILQICIYELYDDEVRGDEDDDGDDATAADDGGRDDVVFCLYYIFAFVNCMMMKCVVMMMTKTTTTMMTMMMMVTTMVVMTGDVRLHIIILHAGEREANCDDTLTPSAWSLSTLQAMQATPSLLSAERYTTTGCPPLPESTPNSPPPPQACVTGGSAAKGEKSLIKCSPR